MPARDKIFKKMQNNPVGWKMKECLAVANSKGVIWKTAKSGSHYYFFFTGQKYPIPAHQEIAPIIIKGFVKLVEKHIHELEEKNGDSTPKKNR